MAEKKYNIKVEIPHCDKDMIVKVDVDLTNFTAVQEVLNILAKEAGVSIGWPKKGGGGS